jgi:hypothetical protein
MVKALNLVAIVALASLCACTTPPSGSFCDIAEPIRPANVDVLTDAEVSQILSHNAKGAALCGWIP